MENTEHEKYLAGLMLHAIEDNPRGDFRVDEILASAKYEEIKDLGAKAVFYALSKLFEEGVEADIGTIFSLSNNVGSNSALIAEIYGLHYSMTAYEWHLSEIRSNLAKNSIFKGLKELSLVFNTNTLGEVRNSLEGLIEGEKVDGGKAVCFEEIKEEIFHTENEYIHTGSTGLDFTLNGGFQKGQMITLAGRPGMGKTSYALQLVTGRKKMGKPTLVFTMEMTAKDLMVRLISQDIAMPMHSVLRAKKQGYQTLQACESSVDSFKSGGVELFDKSAQSVSWIKSQIKSSAHKAIQRGEAPADLIVIDYLGLLDSPLDASALEYAKLTDLSREIKKTAMECGIAILILAQLNRGVEQRSDPIPMLSDLRGSGAIEQDSNKVLFVYRPSMYSEDNKDKNLSNQDAYVIIAKNREGAVGKTQYSFNPEIGIWNEY